MQPRYNYSKRRTGPSQKTITIIGVVIGVLIVLIVGLYLLARPGGDEIALQRLVGRLETLQTMTKDGSSHAKTDKIRKLNSELSLHLAGDLPAVQNIAKARKIKLNTKAIADPSAEDDLADLKAAAVNDGYDIVYERVVAAKLDETIDLIAQARRAITNKSARTVFDTTTTHLSGVREQFE